MSPRAAEPAPWCAGARGAAPLVRRDVGVVAFPSSAGSHEMIGQARRHRPDLEFLEADAERLPFSSGSFDAVVMNFGVLHLSNPDMAFTEARRVLRPGGRFAFTAWAKPEINPGVKIVSDAI